MRYAFMLSRSITLTLSSEVVAEPRPRSSRAPRSDGRRTTLRVPFALIEVVDKLAAELHVSRNDALLRLASRGASLYEQERRIAELRDQRWQAVMATMDSETAGEEGELPSADELYETVMSARADLLDPPPD